MANLIETLRSILSLASAGADQPAHVPCAKLREIKALAAEALGHVGDCPTISNIDAWGDEDPTEASRR